MLNSSHKSISPGKKLLRLVPIVRAPSINRTWEILSGTIPTGQKLQQWEEKRAVPRAGSPFIWCVHGNSSLEWRKQGKLEEVLFWRFYSGVWRRVDMKNATWSLFRRKCWNSNYLLLRWEKWVCQVLAKRVAPRFPLCVLFTEFIAIPKDGLVMKFAWK